ncbi:hypothetical protein SpAn4DRAFT_2633 [Sporomusa ovata]|uniref:Uncharacterized protein n=1 Tax=Sporomusa ovata TaxID=2378 RepID=A0A0U1L165_9FIRM|nr:hypothetical protein SpAn4DRAFT_2633 [Sporomusa ovata]
MGGTVAAPLELDKNWPEIERRFREMGFNRAFRVSTTAAEVVKALKEDLGIA